ncbi:MAG: hypothetical protein Q7J45_02940 [bacterium]|nr:hypothetical protein [bacterium]
MNSSNKPKIFIGLLILAVIGGGVFLFTQDRTEEDSGTGNKEEIADVRSGEIKVVGTIACLPYNLTIAGQECVKGLKGDDGKVYALNTATPFAEGAKVTAIGVFQPANTTVDDSSVFRYDGVLVARSLKAR